MKKNFLAFFTRQESPFPRTFRRLMGDSRGSIAILAAVVLSVLVIGAGVAVDGMRLFVMTSELRAITDAAAVSAGANPENNTKEELEAAAKLYIDANKNEPTVGPVKVVENINSYDEEKGKFTLELTSEIPALLLKAAGIDKLKARAKAVVERALPGPVEIALVVDSTEDLNNEVSGICTPGDDDATFAITKIQDLVNCGLQRLVNQLASLLTAKKKDMVRIGIVPYGIRVNVGTHAEADWLNPEKKPDLDIGCVGYRIISHRAIIKEARPDGSKPRHKYPRFLGSQFCKISLLRLSQAFSDEDKIRLKDRINGIVPGGPTFTPSGLTWGWHLLANEAGSIFTDARTKDEMKKLKGRKIMVLFTMGTNTSSPSTDQASNSVTPKSEGANLLQADLCKNIKADGIEVFVVYYTSVVVEAEKTLIKTCASEPTANVAKYFHEASTSDEVVNAFNSIALAFRPVKLTD